MYVGGPQGFFVLKTESNNAANLLEAVHEEFGMVWDILLFQDKMLVGSGSAVYEVDKNGESKKIIDEEVTHLFLSKLNSNRVFIGSDVGLTSIYNENGIWALEKTFKEIHYTVARIVETEKGDLWLGLDSNKVAKLSFKSHVNEIVRKIRKYNFTALKMGYQMI